MKPMTWVTLFVVTMVGLMGISQVPLVQDAVTASGFTSAEVFSGIATILLFIYVALGIFTVRS